MDEQESEDKKGNTTITYVDPLTGSIGISTTTGNFPYALFLKAMRDYQARKALSKGANE